MIRYIHCAPSERIQIAKKGGNPPSKFIKKKPTKTFNHGRILYTLILAWHGAVYFLFISHFMSLLWVIKFHFMRFLPERIPSTSFCQKLIFIRNNVRHEDTHKHSTAHQLWGDVWHGVGCIRQTMPLTLLSASISEYNKRIPNWNYSFPAFCGQDEINTDRKAMIGGDRIWCAHQFCISSWRTCTRIA